MSLSIARIGIKRLMTSSAVVLADQRRQADPDGTSKNSLKFRAAGTSGQDSAQLGRSIVMEQLLDAVDDVEKTAVTKGIIKR